MSVFANRHICLELGNLSPSTRRVLGSCICHDLFFYLLKSGQTNLIVTVFWDEGEEGFGNRMESRDGIHTPWFKQMIELGSEAGLNHVICTQDPDGIASCVKANTDHKIISPGGTSTTSYLRFAQDLGATRKQIDSLAQTREPWLNIAGIGSSGYCFRYHVPNMDYLQPASQDVIDARAKKLHSETTIIPPVRPSWRPGQPLVVDTNEPTEDEPSNETSAVPEKLMTLLHAIAEHIVQCVETKRFRDLPGMEKIWTSLNITSGSDKRVRTKGLAERKLIKETLIRIGRSNRALITVTRSAWDLLNTPEPKLRGKGDFPHQVVAETMLPTFIDGKVVIEGRLHLPSAPSEFKQIDLLHTRCDGLLHGYEIGISSTQQEVHNAILDFEAGVDLLTVVTLTKARGAQIEAAMAAEPRLARYLDQISFTTAGRYFQ